MRDCDCIASRKTSSANGVPIITSASPIKHQGVLSAFRDQIPAMIAASCASVRDTIIGHDRASFMCNAGSDLERAAIEIAPSEARRFRGGDEIRSSASRKRHMLCIS
jgi:hypothetical protein